MTQPRASHHTSDPAPGVGAPRDSSKGSSTGLSSDPSATGVVVTALGDERCLRAVRPFQAGEPIVDVDGVVTPVRNRLTVEIGVDRHLDPAGHVWGYANHACDPNAWIDLAASCLRALRPIAAGQEITWNYLCTEWELSNPFQCRCGAPACHGTIRGLCFVSPERIAAFASQISPLLRSRLHLTPQRAVP